MRRAREVRHLGSDLFEPSGSAAVAEPSNFQLVAAFQIEDFAGFVQCRDFETEAFDDLAGKLHVDQGLCEAGTDRQPDVSPRGKTISGQAISICGATQMLG
jgi:hypothetical protein